MSHYLALYRKYRPATFAELVGQEAVARTLSSAIKLSRLGHAYLFCGPRGTGKTSVARILAKSVNCQQGPTDLPCGTCANCREITNGNNLDVIEIDAASNNGVDNIRDLQDRVALAPVSGRYKVYIIDEVHMLSQGAFNALLKTLEEPPPNVLFVLATTDPHKVLPTIISRCQRFDFGRIALGPLVGRLRYVSEQEGIQIEEAGLEAIARRANGGLRDALSLLDQIAAMADGQAISAQEVASSLGLLSGESVCRLGRSLIEGAVADALTLAQEILAAGYDHGTVLRELMAHFRHLMLLQLAPERSEALDIPLAQMEELRAQAKAIPAPELPWVLEVLNETEQTVRRSPQQAIWLELGLIKVAKRPPIPSFVELVERVERLEAALSGGGPLPERAPAPRVAPVRPPSPPAAAPSQSEPPRQPAPPVAALPQSEPPRPATAPAAASAQSEPPRQAPVAPPEPARPAAAPVEPPRQPARLSETGRAMPPMGPTASPPAARPAAPPPAEEPEMPAPEPVMGAEGLRALPNAAWDRVREHVRSKSVPTAALLDQQAAIDRWEANGAVVIRIGKAFKDTFDKAGARKKVLTEAIVAVFGAGNFPRLEVGDPKAAPTPVPAAGARPMAPVAPKAPPPAPVSYAPMPSVPVPTAPPVPAGNPAFDDVPPPEAPPDWLDEMEDSRPDPDGGARSGAAAPAPAPVTAAPVPAKGQVEPQDNTIKLAVELFNGRVVASSDG